MQASCFQNNNYLRFGIQSIRKFNPCCGRSLQTGAKIIALVQLSWACLLFFVVLGLIVAIAAKVSFIVFWEQEIQIHLMLTAGLLIFILRAFFHGYLYKSIQQGNYKKVNKWWMLKLAVTMFILVQSIYTAIDLEGERTFGIFEIVDLVLDVYALWVIYEYKAELTASLTEPTVEFQIL